VIAALGAACLALVSCGEKEKQLNTRKAETEIKKDVKQQTGLKATVRCPKDVPLKKRETFECTLKAGDDEATAKVTQVDNKGSIKWRTGKGKAPKE
jgi:hypothetical protein